jgi:hypothetical protein
VKKLRKETEEKEENVDENVIGSRCNEGDF